MFGPLTRVATGVETTSVDLWGGIATVSTHGPGSHEVAVAAVRLWLDQVDAAASTYRDDSDLARLNADAGTTVVVGPLLAEALAAALDAAERTDGAVDPTVGTVTLGALPAGGTLTRTGSHRDVHCTPTASGARVLLPRGMRLDLGATAKAWAADRAALVAAQAVDGGALVSLMGDIATAGPAPAEGWLVVVTDDHREGPATANPVAQAVSISGGGLATSSTTVRARLDERGATLAHVIDPWTWTPVNPVWRTVSVAAADCLTANTASTAAIVLGARAVAWLAETGLPARLVSLDGEVVRVGAWPAPVAEVPPTRVQGAAR